MPRHQAASVALNMIGRTYSVTLPSLQHYRFELVSVNGASVLSLDGVGTTFKIPTTGLSLGAYVATVKGNIGTFSDRIIVR